jgi:hypothetical protein
MDNFTFIHERRGDSKTEREEVAMTELSMALPGSNKIQSKSKDIPVTGRGGT